MLIGCSVATIGIYLAMVSYAPGGAHNGPSILLGTMVFMLVIVLLYALGYWLLNR